MLNAIRHYPAVRRAARAGAKTAADSPDPRRAVESALAALPPHVRRYARVTVTRPSTIGRPATVRVLYRTVSATATKEVTR